MMPSDIEIESAIQTRGLSKAYGELVALNALDLKVEPGIVFGYLGPNGAGKTTTIRLLMGLIRPTAGSAEVLGLDVTRDRELVHARVGYLPGEFVAYRDLTGADYLTYLAALRGGVDWDYVELLARRFDLDLVRPVGDLSHGNRQKVGLVQAFMHRPPLLILDEPTSGLDPLMQQEFLALIRETRDDGRTVFLSSHVLDEVEAVADEIGMVSRGRLMVADSVHALRAKAVRRIDLSFDGSVPDRGSIEKADGVAEVTWSGSTAHVRLEGSPEDLLRAAAPFGIQNIHTHEADLEEIFLSYYERGDHGDAS